MSVTAGAEDVGLRLDAFMVARELAPTRAAAQKAIEAGLVTVSGAARQKSHRMADGERVDVANPPPPVPVDLAEVPFAIAYEDDHLMVIDKPAGVVVHPGAGNEVGTLAQALTGRLAGGDDPERRGIVHRLDRDTSGLLVVARTETVHAALQQMIRERAVQRRYLALVDGRPSALQGTIDAPLGRDRSRRTAVSTDTDRPRDAVTHFEIREALGQTTLLDVTLETGRTHQIRAHMAAIGHPVVGDPRYGGRAQGRRLRLGRQWLHANRIMFAHPVTGEDLVCESKPPADLARSLESARRDPVSGGPDGG